MGSRGKSLRLTEEQKCGIAGKEHERILADLVEFRATAKRQTSEETAQIAEMNIRFQELQGSKLDLTKRIKAARNRKLKVYDFEKLEDSFEREIYSLQKHREKLMTKNGVLASKIRILNAK